MSLVNLVTWVRVKRFSGGSAASPIRRLGQRLVTVISNTVVGGLHRAGDLDAERSRPEHAQVLAVQPHPSDVLDLAQIKIDRRRPWRTRDAGSANFSDS